MVQTLFNIGLLERQRGNREKAVTLLNKALTIFERLGDVVNAQKTRSLLRAK